MSKKWLVLWLIGIFLLTLVAGYLFFTLSNEKKKAASLKQAGEFNYQTDQVSAVVFKRARDEDFNPALEITFTDPKNSPLYNQHVIATLSCSPDLSNLVYLRPEKLDGDPKKEEVVQTGIDVYLNAQKDDFLVASCQNEYCFELGGECSLRRTVYGEE